MKTPKHIDIMCQAPVGKVISTNDNRLTVEYKGEMRELRSNLPDVVNGDYVIFSADIAVEKLDEEEAKLILGDI